MPSDTASGGETHIQESLSSVTNSSIDMHLAENESSAHGVVPSSSHGNDGGEWTAEPQQGRDSSRQEPRSIQYVHYDGAAAVPHPSQAVLYNSPRPPALLATMCEEIEQKQDMVQRWINNIGPDFTDGSRTVASVFDGCVGTYTMLANILRQDETFMESEICRDLFDEFRKFYLWNDMYSTRSGHLDQLIDNSSFLKVSVLDMVAEWANAVLRSTLSNVCFDLLLRTSAPVTGFHVYDFVANQ
jgi:hypothetical protein